VNPAAEPESPATQPQGPGPERSLWVIQRPDKIVQYDALTFAEYRTIEFPAKDLQYLQFSAHLLQLSANKAGQIITGSNQWFSEDTTWFWDGSAARVLPKRQPEQNCTEGPPSWFLSGDGAHLFLADNECAVTGTDDAESVTTRFHVWQTDLSGRNREPVLEVAFPPCPCHGGCTDVCPEGLIFAPEGIIDDHFFLTDWVPGQLQSTYNSTSVYRKTSTGWVRDKLRASVESFLDSRERGSSWIERVLDTGCCSWQNANSDQTMLVRDAQSTVFFDEWKRYANSAYDVSFNTAFARFSPNGGRIAFTTDTSFDPVHDELRMSGNAEPPGPAALARIQSLFRDMPTLDVVASDRLTVPIHRITRASLIGWLNDNEILITENGRVAILDVGSGKRQTSTIPVQNPTEAVLIPK
jgi:hypothetical protein